VDRHEVRKKTLDHLYDVGVVHHNHGNMNKFEIATATDRLV